MEPNELGQGRFVVFGRHDGQRLSASRRDREVRVERHRSLVGRPPGKALELIDVPLGDRGLYHDVDLAASKVSDAFDGGLERAPAAAKTIVVALPERVHADRKARDPGVGQLGDALRGEHRAVRADHGGGAALDGERGELGEVFAQ